LACKGQRAAFLHGLAGSGFRLGRILSRTQNYSQSIGIHAPAESSQFHQQVVADLNFYSNHCLVS